MDHDQTFDYRIAQVQRVAFASHPAISSLGSNFKARHNRTATFPHAPLLFFICERPLWAYSTAVHSTSIHPWMDGGLNDRRVCIQTDCHSQHTPLSSVVFPLWIVRYQLSRQDGLGACCQIRAPITLTCFDRLVFIVIALRQATPASHPHHCQDFTGPPCRGRTTTFHTVRTSQPSSSAINTIPRHKKRQLGSGHSYRELRNGRLGLKDSKFCLNLLCSWTLT